MFTALELINKFVPKQERRDVIRLDDLLYVLAKLTLSKRKDKYKMIAVVRKELRRFRNELENTRNI